MTTDRPPRAGWCVHYQTPDDTLHSSAPVKVKCKAGVLYERVWTDSNGQPIPFERRPCFLDGIKPKPGAAPCKKLQCPTKEEADQAAAKSRERIGKVLTAMTVVEAWKKGQQKGPAAGSLDCPICGGRLHVSMASNGHTIGKCETEGCVEWME